MPEEVTSTAQETPKPTEQQTQTKTLLTDEKPGQAEDGKAQEQAPEVIYDLKLPDGSLLNDGLVEKFKAYAKENKFSKDQAQAFLNRENQVIADWEAAKKENLAKQADIWINDVKADKEIGGDKFNENVELAKRVVHRYASKNLIDSLNNTGLGNHPELIRVFAKIGKEMGEDKLVLGGSAQKKPPKSIEEVFYPSNATE